MCPFPAERCMLCVLPALRELAGNSCAQPAHSHTRGVSLTASIPQAGRRGFVLAPDSTTALGPTPVCQGQDAGRAQAQHSTACWRFSVCSDLEVTVSLQRPCWRLRTRALFHQPSRYCCVLLVCCVLLPAAADTLATRVCLLAPSQAAEAAGKLAGLTVDYVISSPFKRCLQTSAGIVRNLPGLPQGHWLVDWQLAEVGG